MAFDQTDFPAISVNNEMLVSLAFEYVRPGSGRGRGQRLRLRLHNWRGRWLRYRLRWLLFYNLRGSRRWRFRSRTCDRATHVGRSDASHNLGRGRSRTRHDRSRARYDRGWSRARDDRGRSRARYNRSRSRAHDRSRTAYWLRTTTIIIIRKHAGIESGERDDERRQREEDGIPSSTRHSFPPLI